MTPRKHPEVAACGIACSLCPTHYTEGPSRCPGCGGPAFSEHHPTCPILSCCCAKHGLQFCSECPDYPCVKLVGWDETDSFVSHRGTLDRLHRIATEGAEPVLAEQDQRTQYLGDWLAGLNEGRSKSFYCLACTQLPLNLLENAQKYAQQLRTAGSDLKTKAKQMRHYLEGLGAQAGVSLKLRRATRTKKSSTN